MSKKISFLLLALIVPALVFTFLKFFGKNEFTVVPLYQTAESKIPAECSDIEFPYFISDSAYSYLKQGHEKDSLLIILYEPKAKDTRVSEAQLTRLQESFQIGSGLGLIGIAASDTWMACSLLVSSTDLVLIDSRKRIRGQYNSNDRDEVDRLMTELDIILKRY